MDYSHVKSESQRIFEAVEKYELEQRAKKKAQKKTEHVSVAMTGELCSKLMLYAGGRKLSISAAARELIEKGLEE